MEPYNDTNFVVASPSQLLSLKNRDITNTTVKVPTTKARAKGLL